MDFFLLLNNPQNQREHNCTGVRVKFRAGHILSVLGWLVRDSFRAGLFSAQWGLFSIGTKSDAGNAQLEQRMMCQHLVPIGTKCVPDTARRPGFSSLRLNHTPLSWKICSEFLIWLFKHSNLKAKQTHCQGKADHNLPVVLQQT